MYKLLLCWRYLLTRYLAFVCIVSVMLGVATLIVVNSVMGGFSTKLKHRLHGLLSDVLIESLHQDGFADPAEKMQRIRNSPIGDKIEAMTPSIEILGLIQISYQGEKMSPRPVRLIGVDPKERAAIGGFAEYMTELRLRQDPSFEPSAEAKARHRDFFPPLPDLHLPLTNPMPGELPAPVWEKPIEFKDPPGCILGYAIAHWRTKDKRSGEPLDMPILQPGDEIVLHTISGQKLSAVYGNVIVTGFFKSEMSEYDSNYVFVPLDWLQKLRTMENRATSMLIRLKDYGASKMVVEELRKLFPREAGYHVETWEDKQGPLLAAIGIERSILNVLLFLIIGVAGFGILAIFAMIVVEKTKDIGILKALGASNAGVMKIFLTYGLLLGVVGAVFGTVLGLALTVNINDIEKVVSRLTGQEVFPRDVYYFDKIPTDIQPWNIALLNLGAIVIAVVFSVVPALKAAMLHPVRALRYE